MRSPALLSMVFVSLIIFASLTVNAEARGLCHCTGEDCEQEPENCKFGTTKVCGKSVCAKGPGERCGGPMNFLGRCSDNGLMCSSGERCHGCYNDGYRVTCYTDNGGL